MQQELPTNLCGQHELNLLDILSQNNLSSDLSLLNDYKQAYIKRMKHDSLPFTSNKTISSLSFHSTRISEFPNFKHSKNNLKVIPGFGQ